MLKLKNIITFTIILVVLISGYASVNAAEQSQTVIILEIEGVINPFTERYLDRVLDLAMLADAELVVMVLDTPGGLESSMRVMVQSILQSPVPVAVFITPEGARATSAGLFILMAADIAAMSPATNLGAATPVAFGGEMDEAMSEKAISDAAALIRGLAEKRGRNLDWVEAAVRDSLSLTATEALDENVIDLVAMDISELIEQMDGREVNGETLNLSSPMIQFEYMNWIERFYHTITEPNIAYLLLSLGTLFLLAELSDPGLSIAGIGAVISFIIGFMALGSLPVNWAAFGLLALSLVMFVVALLTDTEVIVTLAGLVPFIMGSLLLFRPFRPESPVIPELQVSLWLVIIMALLIVGFSLVILRAILTASKRSPRMGAERFIGQEAKSLDILNPNGDILIDHQIWSAVSNSGKIKKGQRVKVVSVSGVRLVVTPIDEQSLSVKEEIQSK